MCHEPDARAPLPPIAGASDVARSADLVLRSSDGPEFAADAWRRILGFVGINENT